MTTTDQTLVNKALAMTFFSALAGEDIDTLLATLHDDATFLAVPIGGEPETKAQIAESFPHAWASVADRRLTLTSVFATADMARLEYTNSGALVRDPQRYDARLSLAGKPFDIMACMVLHMRSGKIDRCHEYFDLAMTNAATNS
jgi:ketosteroid isomerase-like protein